MSKEEFPFEHVNMSEIRDCPKDGYPVSSAVGHCRRCGLLYELADRRNG